MDSALHCLRSHTYNYLTKPFQIEALQRSVTRCLESKGLLRLSEEALRQLERRSAKDEKRWALPCGHGKANERLLGYLSQIELEKTLRPSRPYYRIALGLGVRVSDLFQTIQAI